MSGNTKGEGGVMKTEAIRKCIKTEDIVNSIAAQGAVALAELKAIETALAAKDSEILNARREVTEAYVLSLQHILDGVIVLDTPKLVIRIEKTIRGLMEADLSLSPPTGKVLIDIERVVTFIAANTPTRCCGCVSRLIDGVRELKDTQ